MDKLVGHTPYGLSFSHTRTGYGDSIMNTLEKEANEIVSELEKNNEVNDVWVAEVGVGHADVCVEYNERRLPIGFLEFVSDYGDLYVEGTNGRKTELTIQL